MSTETQTTGEPTECKNMAGAAAGRTRNYSPAAVPIEHFFAWLRTGQRGLSSEAIVEHLTGVPVGQRSRGVTPGDPSDFRRCHELLEAVPSARAAFGSMRDASPTWARFVDAWDELTALYLEELPSGHAPGCTPGCAS